MRMRAFGDSGPPTRVRDGDAVATPGVRSGEAGRMGQRRMLDDEGRVIEGGGKGYRYFGRAKELPGVKELFEAATRPKQSEIGNKETM
jgi:hypothetical protein